MHLRMFFFADQGHWQGLAVARLVPIVCCSEPIACRVLAEDGVVRQLPSDLHVWKGWDTLTAGGVVFGCWQRLYGEIGSSAAAVVVRLELRALPEKVEGRNAPRHKACDGVFGQYFPLQQHYAPSVAGRRAVVERDLDLRSWRLLAKQE